MSTPARTDKTDFDPVRRQFLSLLAKTGILGILVLLFTHQPKSVDALTFGASGLTTPVGVKPLGGSQTTGSVSLADADTWYPVPSSALSDRVFLILHNRSGTSMYWTFDDSVNNSSGGLMFPAGGTIQLDVNPDVTVYVRCPSAGESVWYAESQSS
ncbi:MAG: hypothetical protein PHG63_02945 [Candidatus Dojkabacteria bacterium]|nr:hypothetical protein [Candidatus Dojkabacteria bacterium]